MSNTPQAPDSGPSVAIALLPSIVAVLAGFLIIGLALPVINVSPFWQLAISGAAILLAIILNARGEKTQGRLILKKAHSA